LDAPCCRSQGAELGPLISRSDCQQISHGFRLDPPTTFSSVTTNKSAIGLGFFMAISSIVLMSLTVGVIYPVYRGPLVMAQNSGYDRFPPTANGWGTKYPIPRNGLTTPGCRGWDTNLKRTTPGNDPRLHFSTLRLAWADGISTPVSPSSLSR
jgi:hypothetical protein